jgi:hypothetical protein
MTGLAAEFFVAAELLKLGLQTSVTFGAAKAIDLLVYNHMADKNFNVQVKGLHYGHNYFPLNPHKVHESHIYVFVTLNGPKEAIEYCIVRGKDLVDDADFNIESSFPGIYSHSKLLLAGKDRWDIFTEGWVEKELV